jgi:hypothetical protein
MRLACAELFFDSSTRKLLLIEDEIRDGEVRYE